MQTQRKIDFQGVEPSSEQQEENHATDRKARGSLWTCDSLSRRRKGPGAHHHTGGLYEINLHLVLPNKREVAIERTPHQDERFQDFDFALNDAFKRARRRLQDQVRRMRGKVKHHEPRRPAS